VLAGERIDDQELSTGAAHATRLARRCLPTPRSAHRPRPDARGWLTRRPAWPSPRLVAIPLVAKLGLGLALGGAGVAGGRRRRCGRG
jgi:hypothetical protein